MVKAFGACRLLSETTAQVIDNYLETTIRDTSIDSLSGPEPLSTFEKDRAWHVPEE
ncbi:hypothetical protein Fmac_026571 [Flemingia macrophylla]|uniref:Uncharacterized protein n=1 Tax=Flemingia macrophylla TaxID=520843 RepID=A0ABD1LFA1_9FABA